MSKAGYYLCRPDCGTGYPDITADDVPALLNPTTFKDSITIDGLANTQVVFEENGTRRAASFYDVASDSFNIQLFNTAGTVVRQLTAFEDGRILWGADKVWTEGNDGPASGLAAQTAATATTATNANQLGGVAAGSYVKNDAGNYNISITGTSNNANQLGGVAMAAFLQKGGGTMTGALGLAGTGTNQFQAGNGDGASYGTRNFDLSGWFGMGFKDATNGTIKAFYDFRAGKFDAQGGFYKNGTSVVYDGGTWAIHITGNAGGTSTFGGQGPGYYAKNDGGTYLINITGNAASASAANTANKLLLNGHGMANFHWSGQAGQPSWLLGSNSGDDFYVWNPANFSVDNAAKLGGVPAANYLQTGGLGGAFAAIGYAEVGSIALMKRVGGGSYTTGTISAGASLVWCNADGSVLGVTSAGSWMCLGMATGGAAGGAGVTLWKRIAG